MAVDCPVIDVNLVVIGRVHQIIAALHITGARGQRLQNQEFRHRQTNRLTHPGTGMAIRIEEELAAVQRFCIAGLSPCKGQRLRCQPGTAQDRLDPLAQQALGEGFGDIVISAEIEAKRLVELVILRGQEDHGKVRGLPQAPQ